MTWTSIRTFYIIVFLGTFLAHGLIAQEWQAYSSPEEAGWSSDQLDEAFEFADEIGSSAFIILHDGMIVATNGDITRRFMCHSVRKSLLSALYGVYVANGDINLDATMTDLGIDDIKPLSDMEKSTTVRYMLQARSGVYHPAAYETASMAAARPERGSHEPGTFWYYNNWDFNTLCAILMQQANIDFFEDFKKKIADPIGMEDFSLLHTYYHYEPEHSKYPAYPFRMSARDLARIGQLYLQKGEWDGTQVIPANWIDESVKMYSTNPDDATQGYGYMWWVGEYGDEHRNYSAQGVGNQAIVVFPEDNVVMVNRANTWDGERVRSDDLRKLTDMIWAARTGDVADDPSVTKMKAPQSSSPEFKKLPNEALKQYIGTYSLGDRRLAITLQDRYLSVDTNEFGQYDLIPQGDDVFFVSDSYWKVRFERGEDGKLDGTITQLD